MGRRLRDLGVRPSLILTSPAVRAFQTARLFARELGYPLEFLQREPGLYLASPDEMIQILTDQAESFNDVLLCGHNPGLADLARLLSGGVVDALPTCALVVLEAELASWSGLLQARCELVSFEIPGKGPRPEAPGGAPR